MSEKHDAMWGADAAEYIAFQQTEIASLRRDLKSCMDAHSWDAAAVERDRLRAALKAQLEAHNYDEVLEIARKALEGEKGNENNSGRPVFILDTGGTTA